MVGSSRPILQFDSTPTQSWAQPQNGQYFYLQEALGTSDLVETILKENSKTKPLLPQQLMRHREIQLPSGEYVIFQLMGY